MATEGHGSDGRPGEILDLGVVGEAPPALDVAGDAPSMSRRRLLMTAAGVLAAGVAGARLATRSASEASSSPPPVRPPAPVAVRQLPRRLTEIGPEVELYALGSESVLQIHPAAGRVTVVQMPPVGEGQVWLVPVRRGLLIRPVGGSVGYEVPEGERPVRLPPELTGFGGVLPGPDLDHVWTVSDRDGRTMALRPVEGGPPTATVPVPEFATTGPMTDGAGGLIFEGVGGLYHVSPSGLLRTSNAIVLAVGPGTLLTLQRDPRGDWRTVVRTRNGTERTVPVAIGPQLPHGVLAPDGRSVVLYVVREPTSLSLALVGIPSATVRPLDLDVTGISGEGSVVWSPDSRHLFCVDADGRVRVVDAATGTVSLLAADLPAVEQLAVRST